LGDDATSGTSVVDYPVPATVLPQANTGWSSLVSRQTKSGWMKPFSRPTVFR
jgi:hypothetical protein